MKKFILLLLLVTEFAFAQIGGGWDWAFNSGSMGGAAMKHMKYTSDGSEILFGGEAIGAVYFNGTTYTTPGFGSNPGNIKFLGKINSATGIPTILKSYINLFITFQCVTTDDAGNFYVGGAIFSDTPIDLGNGVIVSGSNKVIILKFDSNGNAVWAKKFPFGGAGDIGVEVSKLAVSSSGNIFFWAANFNSDANGKQNYPLFKLDNDGNILWQKDAFNNPYSVDTTYGDQSTDKFIDDQENVYLFVQCDGGFNFDGVPHPGSSVPSWPSTYIKVNSAGTVVKAQTLLGTLVDYQINTTTGNMVSSWVQTVANVTPFNNLPFPKANINPSFAATFSGMIETDKDFNLLRSKDISDGINNPFAISTNKLKFLALPSGKLLYLLGFDGDKSAGVDYLYTDPLGKKATAIVETDANWVISKFITGGKTSSVIPRYIASQGDKYVMSSGFFAGSGETYPTTSYGSVNLTGFNAATNFNTYSNYTVYKGDNAVAQTNSANFPKIGSTNWLGNSTDWDQSSNWSNGVPTDNMKAVFNQIATNLPTVFSSPIAGSIEIGTGVSLTLPSTLALKGEIKNDGIINLDNVGFFQGFGAKAFKGSGKVIVSGSAASFLLSGAFENSLVLNTNLSTYGDLKIPTLTLNTGKLFLQGKILTITDRSSNAITGASETNFINGGKITRFINSTGAYDFPMGASQIQTASISANNLVGVDKLTATYNNGAITGTSPNINYNGTTITSALNGGWFSIVPDQQPTGGTFDATLKIQNSTNLGSSLATYTIMKRVNNTSSWDVLGDYNLATQNGAVISVTNKNLTSFSDFAIGIGNNEIVLSTNDLSGKTLQMFPNPTRNVLNLISEKNIKSISVFDASGKKIQSKITLMNKTQIDLSAYLPGIYFVSIQLEDGTVLTKKAIKN